MDSGYQVFISFKNKDERGEYTSDRALAEELYHHLCGLGLRVFFSEHSLREDGTSDYNEGIAAALDSSLVLVVVGTSAKNLSSEWVRQEWSTFLNELSSGRKAGGQLFTYVDGVPIDQLHILLRGRQVLSHGAGALEELGQFVLNCVHRVDGEDLRASGTSPPTAQGRAKKQRWPLVAGLLLVLALSGTLTAWLLAGGAVHPEIQLSETAAGDQFLPSLCALGPDRVLAVWTSDHEAGNGPDIFGRILDGDGNPVGGEFRVNTHVSGEQGVPVAAALDDGFVVVWNSDGQDGDGWGIYGQLFDGDAKPMRGEFLVNVDWTKGGQRIPAVASLDGGGFVVVWDGAGEDDEWGLFGQLFDAEAARSGDVFLANTASAGKQRFGAVSSVEGGGFVVAWEVEGDNGADPFGIHARVFDSTAHPAGGSFPANSHADGRQRYPTVAGLVAEGFIVVWTSEDQDGSGRGVYGQRYSPTGERVGDEFQVNRTVQGHQWLPRAAGTADGFAAAWVSDRQDGAGASVVFQRFQPDGTRIGEEEILNGFTEGDQIVRALIALEGGRYLAAWEGAGQDGDGQGVFARVMEP